MSTYLSIDPSIYLVYQSVRLSIYLFVCLSTYLSIHPCYPSMPRPIYVSLIYPGGIGETCGSSDSSDQPLTGINEPFLQDGCVQTRNIDLVDCMLAVSIHKEGLTCCTLKSINSGHQQACLKPWPKLFWIGKDGQENWITTARVPIEEDTTMTRTMSLDHGTFDGAQAGCNLAVAWLLRWEGLSDVKIIREVPPVWRM